MHTLKLLGSAVLIAAICVAYGALCYLTFIRHS